MWLLIVYSGESDVCTLARKQTHTEKVSLTEYHSKVRLITVEKTNIIQT